MKINLLRYLTISFMLIAAVAFLRTNSVFVAESNIDSSVIDILNSLKIEDWKKTSSVDTYNPDNLFEYIDGAAELYLAFDFVSLYVVEYTTGAESESIVIEIYEHRTLYDSFGIYSQEKPTEGNFLEIGSQGYIELPILNFLKGNYYIKLNSYKLEDNAADTLMKFASSIAAKLEGSTSLPYILNCFPENNKIQNTEKYIAHNFLGFDFLNNAFTADYDENDNQFQLFIIEGSDVKNSEEMLKDYLKLANQHEQLKEGKYTVNDPYHGETNLIWEGKYLCGILKIKEKSRITDYLDKMKQLIKDKMPE